MASLNAQRNLSKTQGLLNKSLGRLSSGLRINSAKDDAAGMAISNRFTAQVRGVDQAVRNANDGISMLQTSEGGMQEVTTILQRMREIAVQGSNDTNSASDRASLQGEMDQLFKEIDRISGATQFNGIGLLDGTGGTKSLQIGANSGQTISVSLKSTKTDALNLNGYSKLGELNSGRVGTTSAAASSGLSINGTMIDATSASTAKAAATAINLATGATGVTAVAYNTYKGAGGASGIASGLTINSSAIASSGNMTELVANINRDAAGVAATLNNDGSITLSNDTGDNIVVGGSVSNTGLTIATRTGYIALTDDNNEAISITATKIGDKNATGTASSVNYTATDVEKWGLNISTGSTSSTGAAVTTNALAAGDLVLNGVSVGATTTTVATAGDKAAAINLVKAESGVSASARTEVKYSVNITNLSSTSGGSTGITINGSAVSFLNATSMDNVVSAINGIGNGISASVEAITGKLVISSASGQNIQLATATGAAATAVTASFGAAASNLTTGTIALTSDTGADIKIAGSASSANAAAGTSALSAGFVEQGGSSEAVGQGLSVESLANANNAINRIDDALDKVAVNRSEVGAVQNRLDSTIANLQNASENFSAANGRILDADFAKETADMSKQQILMQAGVAMLAQAKQLPQQVLQLLQ